MPKDIEDKIKKSFMGMQVVFAPGLEGDMKRMFSKNPIYSVPRFFSNAWFETRMAWQRVFRGFDDSQVWNFHHFHSEYVRDSMKLLAKWNNGHPGMITNDEWLKTLKEIEEGFQAEIDIDNMTFMEGTNDRELWKGREMALRIKADRGWELFRKYYGHLWD